MTKIVASTGLYIESYGEYKCDMIPNTVEEHFNLSLDPYGVLYSLSCTVSNRIDCVKILTADRDQCLVWRSIWEVLFDGDEQLCEKYIGLKEAKKEVMDSLEAYYMVRKLVKEYKNDE